MNEEQKHIDLIDLVAKKLTNEATNAELEQLESALKENVQNRKTYQQIIRTWEESEKARGITSQEIENEWERLRMVIDQETQKKPTFSIYRIAAAASLIIISSITAYFVIQDAETTVVAEGVLSEVLEDGSVVTLNANSVLTYADDYNEHTRNVELDGEAYFEVESNQLKPFIIHAGKIDIKVIGTSFNVKAVKNSATSEVVVNSGIVQLTYASKSIQLTAGEKGIVNKESGKLFKSENDDLNYQSWNTKKFDFKDMPLREVIALLNEVYKQSLYIENEPLRNCPITVSFESQSFKVILKILKNTLDLTIKETDKGLLIAGDNC